MKIKRKFHVNNLVRVPYLKQTYYKKNTKKWCYEFYKFTDINIDTMSSSGSNNFRERFDVALMKRTTLIMKKNWCNEKSKYELD